MSLLELLADHDRGRFLDFGTGEYARVLSLQERLRELRRDDSVPDHWLFGEHPATLTYGLRAAVAAPPDSAPEAPPAPPNPELAGAPVHYIDRGGLVTLHSPGQLVLYGIVRLADGSLGGGPFARALLAFMRDWTESAWGVATSIERGRPGLFVEGRKLLSIGISARGGVTMHGVAMNLCNDLALWEGLVACGEPGTRPVSLSELLGRRVAPADARESLSDALRRACGYESWKIGQARLDAPDAPEGA